MEQEQHFIDYIEQSIIRNWNLNALTDYKGATLQYKDVARKIAKFHIVLESAGIQPGDKIAVCGRNSAHWAVTFLATITYGAVIVPILHEFKADNIHNIVNHSEARLLFVCPARLPCPRSTASCGASERSQSRCARPSG